MFVQNGVLVEKSHVSLNKWVTGLKVLSLAHGASPDAMAFSLVPYKKKETNSSLCSVLYPHCSATVIEHQLVTAAEVNSRKK